MRVDSEAATKVCRYDLCEVKDLHVRSSGRVTGRTLSKKHTRVPEKPPLSVQCCLNSPVSDSAGAEQKNLGSYCRSLEQKNSGPYCGRTLTTPPRGVVQGNRETSLVLGGMGLSRKNIMEDVQRSLDSTISPVSSLEREVEFHSDSVQNIDTASWKLLQDCHVNPLEGIRSYNSVSGMLPPSLSSGHGCLNYKLKSSIDNSCGCCEVEEASYVRTREQFGAMQAQGKKQGGPEDSNRLGEFTEEGQGKSGIVQPAKTGHENISIISSTNLAVGQTDVSLNTSLDPQSGKVVYVSPSCSKTLLLLDKSKAPVLGDEPNVCFTQHSLREENELFYGHATLVDRLDLKTSDSILSFEHGSSFVEVDPVPIPGPPGFDLPCFSDMDSGSAAPILRLMGKDLMVFNKR